MSTHPKPIAPLEHDYEMYDNTRETTRLRTEYDLHSAPKPSEKPTPKIDKIISIIRLVLRATSFLIAASMVGIVGYSVWLFQSTKDDDVEDKWGAQRAVWVSNMKMHPTYVVLAVACVAMVISLVVLIAMITKQNYRRVNNMSTFVTAIASCIGTLLWFGVCVWYRTNNWKKDSNLDMTNYICRHRNIKSMHTVLGNMDGLCGALAYAFAAPLLAFSIELLSSSTVGVAIMVAKKRGGGAYTKV